MHKLKLMFLNFLMLFPNWIFILVCRFSSLDFFLVVKYKTNYNSTETRNKMQTERNQFDSLLQKCALQCVVSPSASHIRLKPENIFIDSQLYRGVRVATQFQSSISIMIEKRTHAQTQTQTIRSQQISQLNTIALETRLRLWILSMQSRPNIQVKRPKPNQ